ncbi:MAG: hypothetical protein K0Q66_1599 [Chitinophagaceae bacterium]|jgi:uncharacterized protein (TIGR02453 family)|nr:hypothetical protein [Chitinophagaceae bacterium]
MSYFTPGFIKFFKELSQNNTSEWFNEHRKVYEAEVKKPFAAFVDEMIKRIKKHEPEINIKAPDAIMRINKDTRFSKDKTPYNTHVAANISAYGKKDKSYPGFYFQFSHDKIVMYGGAYTIETPALQKIRSYIAQHQKAFASAYTDPAFVEKFTRIQGEQNKRLPEEFAAVADKEPLIANKQFFYSAELKPDILLIEKLPDTLMEFYVAGRKVNTFLKAALK